MRPTKLLIATAVSFALAATVQAAAKDFSTYRKELQTAKRPIDSSSCDQNSKIASVKVLKSGETAMVSDAAMEKSSCRNRQNSIAQSR